MKKLRKEKTNSGKNNGGNNAGICRNLFREFLKIGLFTIGGGMAMIPQLQHVAVEEKKWLTEDEMIDCIAVSQALPGVIAINTATYIGMKLKGIRGAAASTLGVITPSFVIIILAVTLLENIGENPYVQGAFTGVKAAVCGLILVTVIKMGRRILRSWFAWLMAIVAFAAIVFLGINAVWAILAGAIAGIVYNAVKIRVNESRRDEEADK